MRTAPGRGLLRGTCANCKKDVYESKWILDDAYNVWVKARPLSGLEVARLPAGTVITDATAEPQQPLDNADEDGDSEDDLPHGFRGGDAVE